MKIDDMNLVQRMIDRVVRPSNPEMDGNNMVLKYFSEGGYPLRYGTDYSAGIDLPFYDKDIDSISILPKQVTKLKTGIHLQIPTGYYAQADSRSSTAKLKLNLMCHTVDSDYRGNIRMVLINLGREPVVIHRGDYMCQMVIKKYEKVSLREVQTEQALSETVRGHKGFGSTGLTSQQEFNDLMERAEESYDED